MDIFYFNADGLDLSCSSIQTREAWEVAFDKAFIKPVVEVHNVIYKFVINNQDNGKKPCLLIIIITFYLS